MIPGLGESPDVLDRERLAALVPVRHTPPVDGLIRPEEEDGRSGEWQVVVPPPEGHQEMHPLAVIRDPAMLHAQDDRMSAICALRLYHRIDV